MNVVLASAFRNSAGRVRGYMRQVSALRDALYPHTLRVVAVEGDSLDLTRHTLAEVASSMSLPLRVVVCEHGGPDFGSVETPERMRALSKVGNAIFDSVIPSDDALLYVESDLIWTAPVLKELAEYVFADPSSVYAPMVMAGQVFYDIWGFRGLDGTRFGPFPPFHPSYKTSVFDVSSVGSCLAVPTSAALSCRIRNDNCLVGWCADARAHGYRIKVVPHLQVSQV